MRWTGPLEDRGYRSWFFSQSLSSAGVQTQNIGAAWVVFLETHSGTALAALTVATMGPNLLLAAFTGTLLQRYPARSVLLVTQSSAMISGCALGLISLGGMPPLAAVYALSFLAGLVNAFDGPARQLIVVDYVGRDRLGKAVSLYEVSLSLARTAGPALGGALLGLVGPSACFFFNAATYLGPLAVLAVFAPRYAVKAEPHGRDTSGVRASSGFAFRNGTIRSCLLIAAVSCAVVNTTAYFPEFSARSLGLGSTGYGLLVACLGIGALPGALLAARLARRHQGRRVALAGLATAAAALVTGLAPVPALAFAGAVLIGATSICLVALANTLTQLTAPARLRGGIMGLWVMALPGMTPVTGAATGALADGLGPRSVFFAIAAAMTAAAALSWRPLRQDPVS